MELLEALTSPTAFADRRAALSAVTADMPEACFVTGDMGGIDEFIDEIAATVYAEKGETEAEPALDKPLAALEEVGELFAEAKPSADARPQGKGRRLGVRLF